MRMVIDLGDGDAYRTGLPGADISKLPSSPGPKRPSFASHSRTPSNAGVTTLGSNLSPLKSIVDDLKDKVRWLYAHIYNPSDNTLPSSRGILSLPVYDQFSMPHLTWMLDIAGQDVTQYIPVSANNPRLFSRVGRCPFLLAGTICSRLVPLNRPYIFVGLRDEYGIVLHPEDFLSIPISTESSAYQDPSSALLTSSRDTDGFDVKR